MRNSCEREGGWGQGNWRLREAGSSQELARGKIQVQAKLQAAAAS